MQFVTLKNKKLGFWLGFLYKKCVGEKNVQQNVILYYDGSLFLFPVPENNLTELQHRKKKEKKLKSISTYWQPTPKLLMFLVASRSIMLDALSVLFRSLRCLNYLTHQMNRFIHSLHLHKNGLISISGGLAFKLLIF